MKLLSIFLLFMFCFQNLNNCNQQNVNEKSRNSSTPTKMDDSTKFENLPDGVRPEDEVKLIVSSESGEKTIKIITVREKLIELGAKYVNGKLVDGNGREIKFYKPPVRGASQGFEEDRLQQLRDEEELKKLEKDYTVIILYVNPLKIM